MARLVRDADHNVWVLDVPAHITGHGRSAFTAGFLAYVHTPPDQRTHDEANRRCQAKYARRFYRQAFLAGWDAARSAKVVKDTRPARPARPEEA